MFTFIHNGSVGCGYYRDKYYVYYEDSIVYFYMNDLDNFQMLYNFKAKRDSSWTFVVRDIDFHNILDTVVVTVKNVRMITINNQKLKKLSVTYSYKNDESSFIYPSEIVETIGDLNYMFNIWYRFIECDFYSFSYGLRCYEDSNFGYYSTGIADSCTSTYTRSVNDNALTKRVEIYPNPSNGLIYINAGLETDVTVEIHNLMGIKYIVKDFKSQIQIDISSLPNGLYFAIIKQEDNIIGIEKFIKN